MDDAALLKRWTSRRDAQTFNEIVERFADQVFTTCRRVVGNEADAEEVAQDCFLLLLRSRGEIRSSLGGWLHGVATNKGRERVRSDVNRRKREQAYARETGQIADASWDDIQEFVDAALETLPPATRDVIVAHFIGRKTQAAIASELRISRRAVSHRIQRGLASVRRELGRRGVAITAVAVGSALAADASVAPTSLKASLGKLAIAAGTASGTGGGTAISALLGSLLIMKTKIAVVCVVACLFAVGFALLATRDIGDAPVSLSGNVTDEPTPPVTGQQVAEAIIDAVSARAPDDNADDAPTLEDLLALSQTELERTLKEYPAIANPDDYALVSGVVLDRNSYAIPRAKVTLVPTREWGKIPSVEHLGLSATSDAEGAYHIVGIAHSGDFRISAAKPGYVSAANYVRIDPGTDARSDFTLQDGLSLEGRVLSASGIPVPDAYLFCIGLTGPRTLLSDLKRATQTDAEGRFVLGFAEKERGLVAAVRVQSASQGASTFPDILIQDERPVELRLTGQAVIRGTVRNPKGNPLPGAHVKFFAHKSINLPRNDGTAWASPSFAGNFVGVCDESGRYATEVDSGMDYEAKVEAPGAADKGARRDVLTALQAGETREYNPVVNTGTITVRAAIVGLQTGKPFASYVMVGAVALKNGNVVAIGKQDGYFAVRFVFLGEPAEYSFQAVYLDNPELTGDVSGPYDLENGDDIDITLNLPDPQSFSVRAVDPNGEPVAGAAVQFRMETSSGIGKHGVTNSEGRLDEPVLLAPLCGAQVVLAKPGYATAYGAVRGDQRPGTVHPEETLVLWPAAGFEGDLEDNEGNPLPDTALTITVTNSEGRVWPLEISTDSSGHFTIGDQAPADLVDISISREDSGAQVWSADGVVLQAGGISDMGEIVLEAE